MFKMIQKMKAKKGFTLVELIVVVAIIAVLAAILIPLMGDYLQQARIGQVNSSANSMRTSINVYMQATIEAPVDGVPMQHGTVVAPKRVYGAAWRANGDVTVSFTSEAKDPWVSALTAAAKTEWGTTLQNANGKKENWVCYFELMNNVCTKVYYAELSKAPTVATKAAGLIDVPEVKDVDGNVVSPAVTGIFKNKVEGNVATDTVQEIPVGTIVGIS